MDVQPGRAIGRAIIRRCPNCGRRGIFDGYCTRAGPSLTEPAVRQLRLRAAARPPFRPAAAFCDRFPPEPVPLDFCERDEPELLPPRFEAPGALAILAALAFDMPFLRNPSYCFSFLTLARLFGITHSFSSDAEMVPVGHSS